MRHVRWDDSREVWVLEGRTVASKHGAASGKLKRPMSVAGQRRPTSAFAKMANAIGDMNPRFKSENILSLDLDMPGRTTYDYECQGTDERVQVQRRTIGAHGGLPATVSIGDCGSGEFLRVVAVSQRFTNVLSTRVRRHYTEFALDSGHHVSLY